LGVGIYISYALPFKPANTCKGPVILGEGLELHTISRVHGGVAAGVVGWGLLGWGMADPNKEYQTFVVYPFVVTAKTNSCLSYLSRRVSRIVTFLRKVETAKRKKRERKRREQIYIKVALLISASLFLV
jgi:hypothetical protein